MYAFIEKGTQTFFEEKLSKISNPPIVSAIGGLDVLCAAFFQESAYSFYCADSVISTGPLPGTMFKRTYLLPLSSLYASRV